MTATYQRSAEAFAAPLDDSVMILNTPIGRYHELKGVAGRIWELLAEPRSENDIVTVLLSEYEIGETECRAEVVAFLDKLRERKLLTGA